MYAKLKIGKHLFSEFKINKVLKQGDAVCSFACECSGGKWN